MNDFIIIIANYDSSHFTLVGGVEVDNIRKLDPSRKETLAGGLFFPLLQE